MIAYAMKPCKKNIFESVFYTTDSLEISERVLFFSYDVSAILM